MNEVLGLRARFAAALVAVSVLTLAVTAVLVLVPLDSKLEQDALTSLDETTRAARSTFQDLSRADLRSPKLSTAVRNLRRLGEAVALIEVGAHQHAPRAVEHEDVRAGLAAHVAHGAIELRRISAQLLAAEVFEGGARGARRLVE